MNPLLVPLILAALLAAAVLVWGLVQRHESRGWQELYLAYVERVGHRAFPQYDAPATNNGASASPAPAADAAPAGPNPQAAAAGDDPNGPPQKRIERWPL